MSSLLQERKKNRIIFEVGLRGDPGSNLKHYGSRSTTLKR